MDDMLSWDDATVWILLTFFMLAGLEFGWPARRSASQQANRITINFALGLTNLILATVPFLSTTAIALFAARQQWGLFQHGQISPWLAGLIFLPAVSLLNYCVHVAFHKVPWLWRLHAVHHHDDAIDLSTTIRAHPISASLMTLANGGLILLLGPEPVIVITTNAILFCAALVQHANFALNDNVSAFIEPVIATPRLHLIHHARERSLHDSNYGELFSIWDHLFGTFCPPLEREFELGAKSATN